MDVGSSSFAIRMAITALPATQPRCTLSRLAALKMSLSLAAEHGSGAAMIKVSDDYARGVGGSRDLVEAYAWLQLALQVGAPEELQLEVLAKIEQLGARLVTDRRDEARARAVHLAELVRARMRSSGPRGAMSGIPASFASTQWVMAPLAATTSDRRSFAE